jgi:hypothetical protein
MHWFFLPDPLMITAARNYFPNRSLNPWLIYTYPFIALRRFIRPKALIGQHYDARQLWLAAQSARYSDRVTAKNENVPKSLAPSFR